jgi:hypothetical protein
LGHKKYPNIPAMIMKILPIQTVSIQTPIIPPTIPIINIKKRMSVLDDVGNIYDAIKLADEPAGDVKKNIKHIKNSSQNSYLIH